MKVQLRLAAAKFFVITSFRDLTFLQTALLKLRFREVPAFIRIPVQCLIEIKSKVVEMKMAQSYHLI